MPRGYGVKVQTAPASEPLTTDEAKSHLKVSGSDDDTLIDNLVKAAREQIETATNKVLINTTFDLTLNYHFPARDIPLVLPRAPVSSVTSITYIDVSGDQQTWAASNYALRSNDQTAAKIEPTFGKVWPTTRHQLEAATIRFVAGYGSSSASLPQVLREAMLLLITHFYEHRSEVEFNASPSSLPFGVRMLSGGEETWL